MKKIFILVMILVGVVFAQNPWEVLRDKAQALSDEGKLIEAADAYIAASKETAMAFKNMPAWMYNNAGYMLIKKHMTLTDKTGKEAKELLEKAKSYLAIARGDVNADDLCKEKLEKNFNYVTEKLSKCIIETKTK